MATGIVTVTIAEAAAAQADPGTTSLVILDTSANIAAGLDSLPGLTKLGSIRTADPGFVVAGYAWFAANPATVGLFAARVLDIHDVPASQTLAPQGNAKVNSFSVADTAAQVAKYFSALNQRTRLDGITVTDGKPIVLTASQFATYTYARARVVSGFTVTGATVAAAAALEADTTVAGFTIADTASRITTAIDDLPALTHLTSIKVSGTGTVAVSYAWFVANPATLALFSTRVVDVHDVPAGLTLAVQGNAHVVNFTVTDTTAEIASHFSALNQRTRMDGITVSDSAPVALTATQFATYTYARSVITAGTRFTVSSAAVAVAAGLQADTTVSGFAVADTSANVTAGLDTLGGLTRMTAIRLTDTGTVTAP